MGGGGGSSKTRPQKVNLALIFARESTSSSSSVQESEDVLDGGKTVLAMLSEVLEYYTAHIFSHDKLRERERERLNYGMKCERV